MAENENKKKTLKRVILVLIIFLIILMPFIIYSNNRKQAIKWVEKNGDIGFNEGYHQSKYGNVISSCIEFFVGQKADGLNLEGTNVTDLKYLKYFKDVQMINLINISATNFDVLKDLDELKELTIHCSKLKDVSFLSDMSKLENVDLAELNVDKIKIEISKSLTGLAVFNSKLQSIELINCERLIGLHLYNNPNLELIRGIKELINLKILDLSRTNLQDFSFLSNLNSLEVIKLSNTKITELKVLDKLRNLTEVRVPLTVPKAEVFRFKKLKPQCMVIRK